MIQLRRFLCALHAKVRRRFEKATTTKRSFSTDRCWFADVVQTSVVSLSVILGGRGPRSAKAKLCWPHNYTWTAVLRFLNP